MCSISLFTSASPFTSWNQVKNAADDIIYNDHRVTFYCSCSYSSDYDNDGSGNVDLNSCNYIPVDKYRHRAYRIEWEHIVPASLMPARQRSCWIHGSRGECERNDPIARNMIFDLHNLAPTIGQVNALRSNDRYREIAGEERLFGSCAIEDGKGVFEPSDEKRGDVARVWLYMHFQHGVYIPEAELKMFLNWHKQDPVSKWEYERNIRIKMIQGNSNPWIDDESNQVINFWDK